MVFATQPSGYGRVAHNSRNARPSTAGVEPRSAVRPFFGIESTSCPLRRSNARGARSHTKLSIHIYESIVRKKETHKAKERRRT